MSQATDARESVGADLVAQLRAGDEAAISWRRAARTAVVPRPALWARLEGPARVTVVSAPAGSGKTVLLRSWVGAAGLAGRVAWVSAGREERDPQRFWLSVLDALRNTAPGSALVRGLTAAPDLDGWEIVERLLTDLTPLAEPLWLVIDAAHAALIAQILDLLAGNTPAPPAGSRPPLEPLSNGELRVLRYLPTHLTAPEIATELSVSTSTVKTHMRNLYTKLGVHSRTAAVESARALGLLAPSARQR